MAGDTGVRKSTDFRRAVGGAIGRPKSNGTGIVTARKENTVAELHGVRKSFAEIGIIVGPGNACIVHTPDLDGSVAGAVRDPKGSVALRVGRIKELHAAQSDEVASDEIARSGIENALVLRGAAELYRTARRAV